MRDHYRRSANGSHSPSIERGNKYQNGSHYGKERTDSPGREPVGSSRCLFIGNLSWSVRWQELKDHMRGSGGEVLRAEVFTGEDGHSKGCGIVEYATAKEAQQAMHQLNDTLLLNRRIFVREDRGGFRPRTYDQDYGRMRGRGRSQQRNFDHRGRGNSQSRGYQSNYKPRNYQERGRECKIQIDNLPENTTWQELKDYFNVNKTVQKADVYTAPHDGEELDSSKAYGIVIFYEPEHASAAIEKFDQSFFKGNKIDVHPLAA